ncbi:MAG: hypothetical protein KJ065_20335 [Anaerolineae bacterium]|nr:hypothetical protein [Anaerolineae bacterium]
MNIRQQPVNVPFVERTVSRVRQQLGDAEFQSACAAGRRLSLEEAVAFALKELEP